MFDEIRSWLAGEERSGGEPSLEVAVAALLIEVAHVDDKFAEPEKAAICRILERRFAIGEEAARTLVAEAGAVAEHSAQLFGFVRVVNERLTPAQRVDLLEMLWEVAYADGRLDPLEDTLLRKIGGLIYVPDRDRGAARQRVLRRLGRDNDRQKPE